MARKLIGREQSSGGDPVGGAQWVDGGRKLGVLRMLFAMAGSGAAVAAPPPAPSGSLSTTFGLTSPNAGTLPFTIAHYIKDGDVSSAQDIAVTGATAHVTKLATYPSGNLRHVEISGTYTSVANVTTTVTIATGTASTGTALTSAAITSANPSASFQVVGTGTLTLASLLASPVRTWTSGAQMVDCQYRGDIGGFEVTFYVRYYLGGRSHIMVAWANGFLDNGSGGIGTRSALTSHLVVSIGGVTRYDNTEEHPPQSRAMVEGWVGGDPQVTPSFNWTYLIGSGLVKNYGTRTPSEATRSGWFTNYTPHSVGNHDRAMAGAGATPTVALLPGWEAALVATGDARAYRATLAGASAINSFCIDWRDSASREIPRPSAYGRWTNEGFNGSGNRQIIWALGASNQVAWEVNHHPEAGPIAYALTGHRWFYETMWAQASLCWLLHDLPADFVGIHRILYWEDRGTAWSMRSLGMAVALARSSDTVATEYRDLLAYNYYAFNYVRNNFPQPYTAITGVEHIYGYQATSSPQWPNGVTPYSSTTGTIAGWMLNYLAMTHGYLSELKPLPDATDLIAVRDAIYRWPVMMGGAMGDVTQHPFAYAADFGKAIAIPPNGTFAVNGGEVFTKSYGGIFNSSPGNTLFGASASVPEQAGSTEYGWGPILTALACAVDSGFAGASAALARMTGADNYLSGCVNGYEGLNELNKWAVIPKPVSGGGGGGTPPPPPPPPPPGSPGWYVTLAGMADGTWMQIPGSSMFGVNPDAQHVQDPSGSPQNRVDCWNSMVLNRTNGDMRSPGNGGHSDWQGNEVLLNNLLRTDVSSWNWSYERQPAQQQYAPQNIAPHNLLGEKVSAHTYWSVFDTKDGYITCLGVDAVWGDGLHGNEHILHKFDTTTKSWVGSGSATNTAFSGMDLDAYTRGGMAIHQVTGEIYFTSKLYDSVRILNPANNTVRWGSTSFRGATTSDYVPCAIDHTRGHVVWLGNNFVELGARLHRIAANTAGEFTFTGPAAGVFATAYHGGGTNGRNGYGAHYDATLGGGQGRYIIKTKVPGEIVLMRPMGLGPSGEDGYCERLTTTGGDTMPLIVSNHIVCNRFLPLDMEDGRTVYVYVPNEASNIWVIRPPLS